MPSCPTKIAGDKITSGTNSSQGAEKFRLSSTLLQQVGWIGNLRPIGNRPPSLNG
jgi:hypothetical protein